MMTNYNLSRRDVGHWEKRTSWRGYPYWVWRKPMPRIKDEFLNCVVYMYPTVVDAERGEAAGGSGFLVGVPANIPMATNLHHVYVVTNSHVVNEAEGNSQVIRLNTRDGKLDIIPTEPANWHHHPDGDDIAVTPLWGLNQDFHKVNFVSLNQFLTQEIIEKHKIGPGDDVFIVGRFINHEGKQKNTPSVRFGNISMMPDEPMRHERGYSVESFAVEMRSIGGYSGSPAFVHILPMSPPRPGSPPKYIASRGFGPWLLGVNWSHIQLWEKVRDKEADFRVTEETKRWVVGGNTGMAGVSPAWKLAELLLDNKDLAMLRDDQKKDIEKRIEKLPPNVSDVSDSELFTKEDMENALKKAFKPDKKKKPDEGKKGT